MRVRDIPAVLIAAARILGQVDPDVLRGLVDDVLAEPGGQGAAA